MAHFLLTFSPLQVADVTNCFLDSALAEHAKARPDSVAIRFAGKSFSYSDTNAAANAVAGYLSSRGIGPGDRVAVFAHKSFETIATVFGILRAGAAYVPLDPTAPETRVRTVLSDCAPALVLADPVCSKILDTELPVTLTGDAVHTGLCMPNVVRSSTDMSYILYSSGSTGTPKGICHTHNSGLAYARMAADLCDLKSSDRVSHHTPLHFDMSIFDIFSTVRAGATIVVIPEVYAKMPASLSELVQKEKITIWYSVPFAIAQLTERGALFSRDFSSIRLVMFAGEAMPPRVLRDFSIHVPHASFLNAYGPTETNHCVSAALDPRSFDGHTAFPIGRPDKGVIARTSEVGELLICSDQEMSGYWQDRALTERSFVVLEHEGQNRRFYRTGDMVKRSRDGALTLVGRADRRVKLRGYRIELDEVELVLSRHPDVREAAVVVGEDGQTLDAYLSGQVETQSVARHAAACLPPYAIPDSYTHLTALVRTSTGKIDRIATAKVTHGRTAA
ncbi:MAG: amino acid adenylation domain-containing protein [Pseudomonadota bacterium]